MHTKQSPAFKTCRVATLLQMDCILVTTQSTLQHKPCRLQGSGIEPLTPWIVGATVSSHHCVRLPLDGQNNTFEDVLSSPLGNGNGHYFLKMYRKIHYLSNQGNAPNGQFRAEPPAARLQDSWAAGWFPPSYIHSFAHKLSSFKRIRERGSWQASILITRQFFMSICNQQKQRCRNFNENSYFDRTAAHTIVPACWQIGGHESLSSGSLKRQQGLACHLHRMIL